MLALEHSRRQQFMDQLYDLEQSIQAPYPGLTMDSYDAVDPMVSFQPNLYSYFDNPPMFATAPMPIKQELHQLHEMPPALVSSASAPSIASASSSTVGSPYSGPSHTISSQDGYDHNGTSYGLGVMPTIVNHEAFSQDILGHSMESELSFHGHDKLSDSYVGEYADLSSSRNRSSMVTINAPQSDPSCSYQCAPLTTSPELLSVNTFLAQGAIQPPPATSSSVLTSLAHSPATEISHSTPTFKSPTTPASARPRYPKATFPSVNARPSSSSSSSQTTPSRPKHMLAHDSLAFQPPVNRFQSHFFAQSSGNFIQPLETSCSSLPLFLPFSLPFFNRFLSSTSFLSISEHGPYRTLTD
jgi:hypothetical protein